MNIIKALGDLMHKKGTSIDAGAAATLIIIIAAVIILYILFLPPEAREELLENRTTSKGSGSESSSKDVLLNENVGSLKYFDGNSVEYGVGNIYLYEKTNAEVLDSVNPFIIRNGWFDKKTKTEIFHINNLENTNNVILSFSADKGQGILYIYLNNQIVYEGELTSLSPSPITLKKSLLSNENTLTFEVSGVGLSFWKTNEYQLKNIEIIGDVTDLSGQEGINSFNIPKEAYNNIDYASLNFVPYCNDIQKVGKLSISLNNREIFSAVPVCDDSYQQSFSVNYLKEGENKVKFVTEKGSYSIEQIKVEVEMIESSKAIYYFEINETQMEEIEDEEKEAWLYLEFVDDGGQKKAVVNINGHLRNIDQKDYKWDKDISDFLKEGNNYIEIEPKRNLNIVNLKVILE